MAQQFIDFSTFSDGSFLVPNWKWAQGNGSYSASVSTVSGVKTVTVTASSAGTKILSPNIVDGVNDIEGLIRFKFSSDVGKQGILSLRYGGTTESNTTGYTLSGSVIGGVGTLAIDEGSTGYVSWTNWNYLANVVYWARFRVIGNHLQAKVWTDGTAEPGWMIDTTNSVQATGSYSGIHQYNVGSNIVTSLSFGTNGDSAPTGPTLVVNNASHSQSVDSIEAAIPTSTPIVGFSGGYGGVFNGYGSAIGLAKQNTVIIADNASHAHTVDAIIVTQKQVLSINSDSHAHTVTSPTLTQVHLLTIANSAHGLTSDSPILAITHNVVIDNSNHLLTSDNITIVTGIAAVADNAGHALTSDEVSLQQLQTLTIDSALHSVLSDSPIIVEAKLLSINSTAHSVMDSIGKLDVTHILAISSAEHAHTAESPLLTQLALLVINNANHTTTSDILDIIQFTLLNKPDDALHILVSQLGNLSQRQILAIENALHKLSTDNIAKIFDWTEMNVAFGLYKPDRSSNGSLDEVDIDNGLYKPHQRTSGQLDTASEDSGLLKPNTIQKGNF